MKKLIILVMLTSTFGLLYSQTAPDVLWTKTFGGTNEDYGWSVEQTNDGGFIISGSTNSEPFTTGGRNTWLIKTNENGDTLWTNTYGGNSEDNGRSVKQTNDLGYIVCGHIHLTKTDSSGNLQWQKEYHADYNPTYLAVFYDVEQTTDGGYIVTGSIHPSQWIILKTDSFGNEEWRYTKLVGSDSRGYSVVEASDGGYVSTGIFHPYPSGRYMGLIKVDSEGEFVWQKSFGQSYFECYAYSIKKTFDNGYIITGELWREGNPNNIKDILLLKTDENGNQLWGKEIGGSGSQIGYSVDQTIDSGYVVTGNCVIRTDEDGDSIWSKTISGYSIQQTDDRGFIIVGSSSFDVYLVKIESEFRADFIANPTFGYIELDVSFTDKSPGTPISWKWDFQNDGVYDSFEQNPTYTYTDDGIYDLKLVVDDGTEIDSLIKYDYINVEYVPPAPPTGVTISIDSLNAVITWNPVDTTIYGTPITPDTYILFFNETPYEEDHYYYYLDNTPDTTYSHHEVALFRDHMYYKVVAYKDFGGKNIKYLLDLNNSKKRISWIELRDLLYRRKIKKTGL